MVIPEDAALRLKHLFSDFYPLVIKHYKDGCGNKKK